MSEAAIIFAAAKMYVNVPANNPVADVRALGALRVLFNSDRKMQITVHQCQRSGCVVDRSLKGTGTLGRFGNHQRSA